MVRLIGRSVCSKKVVEDFWDVHFSCATVEVRVVDCNMNGISSFPGNLFAVYYLEVGDVGLQVVVGNAVYVTCTGDMTIMFFYSILKTPA